MLLLVRVSYSGLLSSMVTSICLMCTHRRKRDCELWTQFSNLTLIFEPDLDVASRWTSMPNTEVKSFCSTHRQTHPTETKQHYWNEVVIWHDSLSISTWWLSDVSMTRLPSASSSGRIPSSTTRNDITGFLSSNSLSDTEQQRSINNSISLYQHRIWKKLLLSHVSLAPIQMCRLKPHIT